MSKSILTAHERREYGRRLREMNSRLKGEVAELEEEALRPAAAEGSDAEGAAREPAQVSSEADIDVARTVLVSEDEILAEVRLALARLESGKFGKCEQCGQAIDRKRLDALPYARRCIDCARAQEMREPA